MYMRYRNFIIIIIISFQGERQKPFDATWEINKLFAYFKISVFTNTDFRLK